GRLGRAVTDACLQYWGGMGFTWDNPLSRAYRGVRLVSIGVAADEIMLDIICQMMGVLPGQPKGHAAAPRIGKARAALPEHIEEPAMADLPHCEALLLNLGAGVLHISLNRPDSRNAMSLAMVHELRAVLESVRHDTSVRALVLRGAGGHFCAG